MKVAVVAHSGKSLGGGLPELRHALRDAGVTDPMAVRTVAGTADRSRFVRTTKARRIKVRLDRKARYELDGGERGTTKKFIIEIEPGAMTVCVPPEAAAAAEEAA